VAEQLPEEIRAERDKTIKQAMTSINELTISAINQTSRMTLGMINETAKKISQERGDSETSNYIAALYQTLLTRGWRGSSCLQLGL